MSEQTSHQTGGRRLSLVGVERLGQTIASLCWLASVFVYGLETMGDWLQLGAASAWLAANVAAIVSGEDR